MTKPIKLHYVTDKGVLITEEVLLIESDDEIYIGGMKNLGVSPWQLQVPGHTLFEDNEGIFQLPNERILYIENK